MGAPAAASHRAGQRNLDLLPAGEVGPASRLAKLFGCDTALYLSIERWESQYVVLATSINVAFNYDIKSCKTGETLWADTPQLSYSPQASNSGNPLADLIAQAVRAAIEKGAPNYIHLAQLANAVAAGTLGKGVPAGPDLPNVYRADLDQFPVSAQ